MAWAAPIYNFLLEKFFAFFPGVGQALLDHFIPVEAQWSSLLANTSTYLLEHVEFCSICKYSSKKLWRSCVC